MGLSIVIASTILSVSSFADNKEIDYFEFDENVISVNESDFPFDVNISCFETASSKKIQSIYLNLKNDVKQLNTYYSFSISTSTGQTKINNKFYSNDFIDLSWVELNEVYDYSIIFEQSGVILNGKFSVIKDADGSISADYTCTKADTNSVNSRNTSILNETSSNHSTYINAQSLTDSNNNIYVLKGTITSSGQNDWYKITCPNGISSGTLELMLGCPYNCNYDIYLYSSNGQVLLSSGNSFGAGYGERCRYSIIGGTTYYIKVTNHSGTTVYPNSYYYIYPLITRSKAWYSQYNANVLGCAYWDTYLLDNLYFTGYDENKCFKVDNSNNDLMSKGCAISSFAMVLKNLNSKTSSNCWDFRTNFYGKLIPDPFTLTLRNNNISSKPVYDSSTLKYKYTKSLSATPVKLNVSRTISDLVQDFGHTAHNIPSANINDVTSLLSTHPEGVIVGLKNSSAALPEHWIVFCPSNNSDGYVVYDPATGNSLKGNGVAFTSSYSYINGGLRLGDIDSVYYIS